MREGGRRNRERSVGRSKKEKVFKGGGKRTEKSERWRREKQGNGVRVEQVKRLIIERWKRRKQGCMGGERGVNREAWEVEKGKTETGVMSKEGQRRNEAKGG